MFQIYILFIVLAITLILFISGWRRYDIIASLALLTLVLLNIVPASQAFSGFSNPAVITVICVMIITQTITQTGIIDRLINKLTAGYTSFGLYLAGLTLIAGVLSAFMNNVGALALIMPVAIQTASRIKVSPSLLLMPIAFGSILGGLTTAIGTPPNLLISAYRQQVTGQPFAMFDFAPVGFWVALAAIIFIIVIGWRLLPKSRKSSTQSEIRYQIQDYISEVIIPSETPLVGKTRKQLEQLIQGDINVLGLIRKKTKHLAVASEEILQAEDILIIEASHEDLQLLLHAGRLELIGEKLISPEKLRSEEIGLIEAVVPQNSRVEGRSWQRMRIRSRMHVNLIAISRQGRAFKKRLNRVNLRAGDVILLQGETDNLAENTINLGLIPLAEPPVQRKLQRKAFLSLFVFSTAIALSALQILQVQVAFAATVVLLTALNVTPIRKMYANIDWSVIVLLATMIPIGNALQSTGGTELIAQGFLNIAAISSPIVIIILLLMITMTLSDLMNNVATAVVMAPIAVSIAQTMNVSIDPFLMAVAIGASSAFLTPIGHQNNTLILGPGGYKFQDYIRLGLPVEIIVIVVGVPAILWVWPL